MMRHNNLLLYLSHFYREEMLIIYHYFINSRFTFSSFKSPLVNNAEHEGGIIRLAVVPLCLLIEVELQMCLLIAMQMVKVSLPCLHKKKS